jgi:hypothetical protein
VRQARTEAHAAAEAANQERFAAALVHVRMELKQARSLLLARTAAPAMASVACTALACFRMRETVSVTADMPCMVQHGA